MPSIAIGRTRTVGEMPLLPTMQNGAGAAFAAPRQFTTA